MTLRRVITGGIAVAPAAAPAAPAGAFAGGNGAQRSGLSPQTGDNSNQCVAGSGAGTNGFVIVNAPGPPANARFVNGEVSLKRGDTNAMYTVWIVDATGKC